MMSNDFAVDSQRSEVELPDTWREHVRELRAENARRRKENQELRAQLASLSDRACEADAAQAAASERAERDATRLATVHRRLKELEVGRLTHQALHEAAAQRGAQRATAGSPSRPFPSGGTAGQASSGTAVVVDVSRAHRLLERVPAPVDVDADLVVDDEGQVTLEPAAGERLKSFVEELVDLLSVQERVSPPPVGGEPPRPTEPGVGRIVNSWEPDGQRTPVGKARASLRETAAANAEVLDELAQL